MIPSPSIAKKHNHKYFHLLYTYLLVSFSNNLRFTWIGWLSDRYSTICVVYLTMLYKYYLKEKMMTHLAKYDK